MSETTRDGFLGGRLVIEQPARGYRAGADPILLAASVEARQGAHVLELGCGVGTAMIALGWRVPGLLLYGLEREPEAARLARLNAKANGIAATVTEGCVSAMPDGLRSRRFDVVMANPPFFDRRHGTRSDGSREAGRGQDEIRLETWLSAASKRLAPKGRLALIQHISRLPDTLAGLPFDLGDIAVRPICARAGDAADRFVLTARKGARGPFSLLSPLHLHGAGQGDSPAAHAILRDGRSLEDALLTNR